MSDNLPQQKPELLAPVGDYEGLAAAIKAGADAVYFGIRWINMRSASARNFDITELAEVMKKLHDNNVKGYITLNTLIYDHEIDKVKEILDEVKASYVDGVIATDFATIQLCNEKGIEVHISTQLSVSNYEAVKFFSKFSPRIVLARECTLKQIESIKSKIKNENLNYEGKEIEIETFVHGALCVAYSGRCFMSQYHNRLSANRGQCLQECRRKYKIIDIEDSRREFIIGEDYVMSPKDLCALPILPELIKAGIDVFKIEGRAKGPEYIYEATKAYREAIDLIYAGEFTKKKAEELVLRLHKVFNRGLDNNFYLGVPTNDSWTKYYGSAATERKVKLGRVTNYYTNIEVGSVMLETGEVKIGDEVLFIGPTTGYYKTTIQSMKLEDKDVTVAKKGDEISFKVKDKLRESDVFYKVVKRDVDAEEERILETYEEIGIHKPFKTTTKKGMK